MSSRVGVKEMKKSPCEKCNALVLDNLLIMQADHGRSVLLCNRCATIRNSANQWELGPDGLIPRV